MERAWCPATAERAWRGKCSNSPLAEFEPHLDWRPSWENSFTSIRRIPDEVVAFGAFDGKACAGLLVYYPLINWITTLVVKRDRRRC